MGQTEATSARYEREHEKMRRFRDLAKQLMEATHELEGDRGGNSLRIAAEELRQQAATIARRLDQ